MISLVEKLIGTSTSSLITSVTPLYPVCALSFPFANVGVILIFALIFSLFLFIKYVFPTYSPCLTASSNQPATFCKTISPGEKSDTLFLPIISSFCYQFDGIFIGTSQTKELRNAMIFSVLIYLIISILLTKFLFNTGIWISLCIFMILRAMSLFYYLDKIYLRFRSN